MILLRSWVVLLLLSCSSSVHAYTFGYTPNVAITGLEWTMTPTYLGADGIGGMDISGVTYKYTPIKNKADDYVVTLENNKVGGGYVFQDKQDWSQREGGTEIRRTIALPYTPLAVFGDGRLKQEGTGSIEGADVRYIYRFDRCSFDAQSDPSCPNYVKPKPPKLPDIPDYDALQDESVSLAQKETDKKLLEDEQADKDDEEEDEESLESKLADTTNALTIANEISQSVILKELNNVTNLTNYYVYTIPDNYYPDTVALQGGTIVDNRRALRSLSQDARMNEMIEEQYK